MKNTTSILCVFVCSFISLTTFSQKETWKWYISGNGALDFSSGAPVALGNNAMNLSWEGCSTISDANGNLLFYTDGDWLYDKTHSVPPNGSNLKGCNSVTQVAVFVPKPGNPNIYYLFIIGGPSANGSSPPWSLYYNEIDLTLNGGNGDITANKNISIASSFGNCSEKMTAVKHCNGTDYWLLVHDYTGTAYKAYLITAAGINTTPVVSNVGTSHISIAAGDDALGQMKLSPNGTKVATTLYQQGMVELCDFNKTTGVVSNPINLGVLGQYTYGVEFSPDNSKLYASNGGSPATLKQWDICAGSSAAIIASGTTISSTSIFSMQLASDGKIYGNKFSNTLAVINNPNVAGTGCNYSGSGPVLIPPFSGSSLGLPNFITSYFDTPANSPQATVTPVNAGSCGCTGSATANICAVFGAAPFTYIWSNATTTGPTTGLTATISNLCPGSYSVIVTDATCESDTAFFSISSSGNSFTITPTSTQASCGNNNGTASVSITGGTAPFTYAWNPGGQSTSAVTGLAAGNYTVNITDATLCTSTSVVTITSSTGGTVTITPQNVLCSGSNNGSASATMSGSSSPYTYNWNNGQTTQTATGLAAGNYTCTVTDASGCTGTQTVSITQPTALTAGVIANPTNCGQNTGTAAVTAAGGTSPYTYNWNNGQTTQTATALAAGNYTCTITDANGCTQTAVAAIVNANGPVASITSQTQPGCYGGNNGTASASATGGTSPYTFVWSNGQNGQNATGLSAGSYTVTVTDAGGCSNIQTVTLSQPAQITAVVTNTAASCGLSDGTATATPSGGTSPYTYLWTPSSAATATATGLAAGNYSVTVTDAGGCSQVFATTVASGNGPTANAGTDVTIQPGGSAALNASGGITYNWSPATGLSNPAIANPTATPSVTTIYCVLVSDAGGCIDSACVTVYIELPCGEFYIPNAFSPNGDDENDVFKAYILPSCVKEFKLIVYNRWGEKVFSTDNINESWDGNFRSVLSDAAVYAYYCRATLTNGKEISVEGNVSLVR